MPDTQTHCFYSQGIPASPLELQFSHFLQMEWFVSAPASTPPFAYLSPFCLVLSPTKGPSVLQIRHPGKVVGTAHHNLPTILTVMPLQPWGVSLFPSPSPQFISTLVVHQWSEDQKPDFPNSWKVHQHHYHRGTLWEWQQEGGLLDQCFPGSGFILT